MNRLKNILTQWQFEITKPSVIEVFFRSIYLVVLWSLVKNFTIADIVWGEEYLSIIRSPFEGVDRWAMLLNEEYFRLHYEWFLYPLVALLILGIAGFRNVFTRILVWYLFLLLVQGNYETSTGAHHLMTQALFIHIFMFGVKEGANSRLNSLLRFMVNVSFYALWIQISMMYLSAGVWKLLGTQWLSGDAVAISFSFKEYSNPGIADSIRHTTWLLFALNYLALAYQLLFALLIWFKRLRWLVLIGGAIFHVSIIFVVGLADFGLFMMALYTIFLEEETAKKWMKLIYERFRWKRSLQNRFSKVA